MTTYTDSNSDVYIIAANQNTTNVDLAGIYYLDTTNIWHPICTGLSNGNINSVSVDNSTAYFMVGGTDSGAGLYSCDISKIGN